MVTRLRAAGDMKIAFGIGVTAFLKSLYNLTSDSRDVNTLNPDFPQAPPKSLQMGIQFEYPAVIASQYLINTIAKEYSSILIHRCKF
jgi:hypothetical protein